MHTILSPTTAVGIRPEIELLLCCARTCMDSARVERIRTLLGEEIDWIYVTRMALRHGVMPLLYINLNTTCPDAIPKTLVDQFRGYFHANALNNLFLASELLKLLHLFQEHGIPAIPYKGPVLAASIYGNLTLRQFCDLDILVRERDFMRTRELLISQGYRSWYELDWQHAFVHDGTTVHVDLHTGITPWYFPFRLDFEGLWQRLEPVSLADTTVVNFSPEDLLIILCVQFFRDCCDKREQLAKVCDIAQLIYARQTLDWQRVMEQARTLDSTRIVFLGLLLASDLLGAALPEEVLLKIQGDSVVKSIAVQVCDRLFQEADVSLDISETHLSKLVENAFFHFRMRERLQDKFPYILYLFQLAITPNQRDWAFLPLPTFLSCVYYLLRPIRLAGTYGFKPLQNFLKRLRK